MKLFLLAKCNNMTKLNKGIDNYFKNVIYNLKYNLDLFISQINNKDSKHWNILKTFQIPFPKL